MAQGGMVARITLIDQDGNEIGTSDIPIQVDSEPLRAAVLDLTEEIQKLRELVEMIVE